LQLKASTSSRRATQKNGIGSLGPLVATTPIEKDNIKQYQSLYLGPRKIPGYEIPAKLMAEHMALL